MTQFKIGDYLWIPFGSGKTQAAHLEGFTKDGRLKVRAYNKSKGKWMPNLRTIHHAGQVTRCDDVASLPPIPNN
jgi:hypothetical protein